MTCLAVSLMLSLTLSPALAEPVVQKQAAQKPAVQKAKKVWTNDDIELLRAKSPISVMGEVAPPPEAAKEAAAGEKAAPGEPYVKEKDPKWYQQQLAPLRGELDRIDSEIRRLRDFRTSATTGRPGIVLGQENIPLSPENQIQQLERRRRDVQQQIDDLEALARRNGISPGTLR